ncbi:MAG: uracil-DNA glycosylase [Candidatus Acidulodesulfobacterium acidiphilum]|jgi:DNA polymerase|uniref:Type-4 uracil-DNA glycosylase n=1 Tax=Candidatus Acidulodesulfobacterium acidiphilum TaxID=2597224 RepID=A0A520X856_9DELT|nr:MAG: uracil-DNA glycosylase [Candidatus Acidulodesulfobacterium acidiphilum]
MKEKDELSNLIEDINYFVSGNKESFVFISSISDFFNKIPSVTQDNIMSSNLNNETVYPDKRKALEFLREVKVDKCIKCALSKTRKNIVFGEGNPESRLMFIGEAPGAEEDNTGRPFVGRAGQLLTKIIESINLKREEVYIANIIKCRPPENRNPMENEIASCAPFLKEQIAVIRPEIICTLGKFSTEFIIGEGKGSISSVRGKTYNYDGITVIPTYHPSYLLRNPSAKKETWEDMKKIRELYFK